MTAAFVENADRSWDENSSTNEMAVGPPGLNVSDTIGSDTSIVERARVKDPLVAIDCPRAFVSRQRRTASAGPVTKYSPANAKLQPSAPTKISVSSNFSL